jgi:hypothetical protein
MSNQGKELYEFGPFRLDSGFIWSQLHVHLAPTNLVVAPDAKIRFVGRGNMSLKGAVEMIARGQHGASVRP